MYIHIITNKSHKDFRFRSGPTTPTSRLMTDRVTPTERNRAKDGNLGYLRFSGVGTMPGRVR